MNKREGAIITAFTGYLCTDTNSFHLYAEEKCGRTIYTHEFADRGLWNELKEKSKTDFFNIINQLTENN